MVNIQTPSTSKTTMRVKYNIMRNKDLSANVCPLTLAHRSPKAD